MTQNNKLFYVILAIVILAVIGIVLFVLNKPTTQTPNIQNSNKPSNQNTNQPQNFITAQLDKEFQLKINQTALIKSEDLKITFLNVTEDSRCPSDVLCVWEGQATVVVNILKNDQNLGDFSLTSRAAQEDLELKNFDGYSIKLTKIDPYPKAHGKEIELSDYIVTLIVSKITTSSNYEIKLKSRTFTPAEGIEQFFTDIKAKNIKPEDLLSGKYHGVAQFYEIPTDEQKLSLEKVGVILHDYLPNNAYTASIDPTLTSQKISELDSVRALFNFERNDKLSSEIVSGQIGDWARQESGKVDVIVKYYPDVPNDKAQSALQTFGGQIIFSSDSFQRITIRIDENKIISLADFEWVTWVEPVPPPPTTGVNNINTQCSIDDDCTLINKDINYQACWPGACEAVDYSLDRYIAVNKNAFEEFKTQEVKSRPSDEECGPSPLCPIALINDNFVAKCIQNICTKVSK